MTHADFKEMKLSNGETRLGHFTSKIMVASVGGFVNITRWRSIELN